MLTESPSAFIRRRLAGIYPPHEIQSLTRLILEDGLGIPMLDFYSGKVKELSEDKELILRKILDRMIANEPVQYILGKTEFEGRPFHTAPGVLIPRPETEELVDWIASAEHPRHILDIGTGSGCIAISLAGFFPDTRVEAWDISREALQISTENNRLNKTNVLFVERDVLTYHPGKNETDLFDIIVSNPPYVTEKEKATMEKNVLDWEPATALFVPDNDPLRFYRCIARLGRTLLSPGGKLYFEINWMFAGEMKDMLEEEGYTGIEVRTDLFGRKRMMRADLSQKSTKN